MNGVNKRQAVLEVLREAGEPTLVTDLLTRRVQGELLAVYYDLNQLWFHYYHSRAGSRRNLKT